MEAQTQTVRVRGLPTDIEHDRLIDKLHIHFLRPRNGGGEIASVTIVTATPGTALITFEDVGVAQRVVQQSRHIMKVDEKKYELTLSEHRKTLEPDKIILSMSVTIDYSQLSLGWTGVASLPTSYPGVQVSHLHDTGEEVCTLSGPFSQVQAAVAHLLGSPDGTESTAHRDTPAPVPAPASSGTAPGSVVKSLDTRPSRDNGRRSSEKRERTDKGHTDKRSGGRNSSPHEDQTPGGHDWEDSGPRGAAASQSPAGPTLMEEDFSLLMDADLFRYLQTHCAKEYQHILSQYGIEVVDVTAQGLTTLTLFLQSASGAGRVGRELERLRLARGELSKLYQENEAKVRSSLLPKSILSPRGGLQRALENLSVRFPKLLLSEDDKNVYIIGSSSDVSEAKQFLLLDYEHTENGADSVASLLRSPSFSSGSSKSAEEDRPTPTVPLERRMDKMLRMDDDERRTEGARRHKLAARLKDSGLGMLGNRPGESMAGLTHKPQTTFGPLLGHDFLFGSDRPGFTTGGFSSPTREQNTDRDILFKGGDPLFSRSSLQNTPYLTATSVNTGLGDVTTPFRTTTLSGDIAVPPSRSASGLRRSSSFSGMSKRSSQLMEPMENRAQDSGKTITTVRGRSNSFSNQTGRDKIAATNAELTVSKVMWLYIKDAYATRLENLTADLQMEEISSETSRDMTVRLTGADASRVNSGHSDLQNFVSIVGTDFDVQHLRFLELGVVDPADETLEMCCTEVQKRYKKVSIHRLKGSVCLQGPKHMCSHVAAALREVFSGTPSQIHGQKYSSITSTSTFNQPIPQQEDRDKGTTSPYRPDPEQMDTETGVDGMGDSQERQSIQRSNSSKRQRNLGAELKSEATALSLDRKNAVTKEKVGRGGITEVDRSKTHTFAAHPAQEKESSGRLLNGAGSAPDVDRLLTEGSRHSEATQRDNRHQGSSNQQTRSGSLSRRGSARDRSRGPRSEGFCVCGERGSSVVRTECGATLCPKCLVDAHVHCKVCPRTDPIPPGIHGTVTFTAERQGHLRDSIVKVIYIIPDGIQGESHPSPGCPFRGGNFEAYLPFQEGISKLLPRLEEAFRRGLTFTVTGKEAGSKVTWADSIPHKTSLQGGSSGIGQSDGTYLTHLSDVLTSYGIDEVSAKSNT